MCIRIYPKLVYTGMQSIIYFFQERDPFKFDQVLKGLPSGVVADTSVNVDSAKQIDS